MLNKDDINWLMKEAVDDKTKKLIKYIEDEEINATKNQKFSQKTGFICLNLGKYKIWTKKNSTHSIAHTYVDIFKYGHTNFKHSFFTKDDHIVVDIGANDGFYTMKLKQYIPEAKIYAVEPNPVSFEIMQKNIKSNKLKNVVLLKMAISNKNGQKKLSIVENVTNIGSFYLTSLWKKDWLTSDRIKVISVETITLDKLYKKIGEKIIDLVKVDVEGSEYDVLISGKKCSSYIKKIIVEYHSLELRKKVLNLMKKYNFKLVFEEKSRIRFGSLYFTNNLLTKETSNHNNSD